MHKISEQVNSYSLFIFSSASYTYRYDVFLLIHGRRKLETDNSRVHIQTTANVAVILPMHTGKHLFHARSDTVHIDKK